MSSAEKSHCDEAGRMIVEFLATVEDFADITRRSQRRAASTIPWTWRRMVTVGLIAAAATFALTNFSLAEKVQAIVLLLLAYAFFCAFLLADRGPFYNRTIRLMYGSQFGMNWPVAVRVELNATGIVFTQNGIRGLESAWETVEGIEETPEAIYLLATDKSVMAVRKRGFKGESDLAAFLRFAHQHLVDSEHLEGA